ncbi:MAG: TIGR03905 family TSCPD domain-containing protein [Cellulosilyticum sp.]|nr:TIGR03905 family TSCPD domain-containing protein [Cellulosilyticum sp.]
MEIYKPTGVCASEIHFEVKEGFVQEVAFVRGCPGNALGVAALVKGLSVEEAVSKLKGIDCRGKGTSCPDQLARALEVYMGK